jgi:putative intracellular protease/amidase
VIAFAPRRVSLLSIALVVLVSQMTTIPWTIAGSAAAEPAIALASGTAIARSIIKYFGKEGTQEATEYLARQGGRELAERVATAALRQGGEEAAEQVSRLAAKYGPEALTALDNAPQIGPVLAALDELPASQVRAALTRLSAGSAGRELAETVGRVGSSALRSELKHPGVGGMLARTLGDDGAELATNLSTDQAIAVARHADDMAALPTPQRNGVLALLRNDAERMVGFLGRFAADNPGKTLFTAATTTIVLAESERILGGDEIVFDADGNPIVVTKAGIAGRTMEAGGKAVGHLSANYLAPIFLAAIAFGATFAILFMGIKLWHTHQREKLLTASMQPEPETIEGSVVDKTSP